MQRYNPSKIEKKWQKFWEKNKLYKTPAAATRADKMYILPQLPYPSGSGLHVGHAEVYTACDIYARYQRMLGKKVLQVIGWDAFGLPAENYAIKTNIHPRKSTDQAIDTFRQQIKALGISVDWDREVGSHNPDYYHWTQWFFLLFYKRGLAYRKKQSVNWCDSCKTVLANEQVTSDGKCERCETVVVQREMEQWYIKITDYAERLIKDLDKVDWPEESKKRQRDWIGRSEGALVRFKLSPSDQEGVGGVAEEVEVFTTRPDTLFGATYLVLAPESAYVQNLKSKISNWDEVNKYLEATKLKTDLDRQVQKEKTGVELKGVKAVNPVNNEELPIFVADYVLGGYGTGAIMAVPAHDERDFEFANKYNLPIRQVVAPLFTVATGPDAVRPEKKTVRRRTTYSIVKHWSEDKYLCLDWTKFSWHSGIIGGVEAGEDLTESAKREIQEETGYKNLKFVRTVGGEVHNNFFAGHKDENRYAQGFGMLFELQNDEREKTIEEHTKNHEVVWIEGQKMKEWLNLPIFSYMWNILSGASECFADDGVSVNSDFLNDLKTSEAKEKIINWLEEKGVGKRKIQFKLRDWSVSRQRFWGAPIPMLHNDELKNKKYHYVLLHGFKGTVDRNNGESDYNWQHWLRIKLEKEGHTVFSPDLPNTGEPKIDEQVDFVIKNTKIDEHTILVGQSLGGVVVYKLLEKLNKKVARVFLVDPVVTSKFPDCERPAVEKSCDWKFDWEKIKQSSDEFVILGDAEFKTIFENDLKFLTQQLNGNLVLSRPSERHFTGAKEPMIDELLDQTGWKMVPESDLPVILPNDVDFKPTGESPLNYSKSFNKGVEKKYGKGWKREPDTLDTFMCSSWYYYRYLDPSNDKQFASPEALKAWMPVDFYLGGPEHVNGHLLYSRFFTKVLFDAGYIDFDEPFLKHRHQGLILGEDSRKMSKRWGNVINPTDVVNEFGADTFRMYEMFMGPLEQDKPWDTNGVRGVRRFLEKVWALREKVANNKQIIVNSKLEILLNQTIKKVTEDAGGMKFNTAISQMMTLVNELGQEEKIPVIYYQIFLKLLCPFAPHLCEELWFELGNKTSLTTAPWPAYDSDKITHDTFVLAIQVNGKLRDTIEVSASISEDEAKRKALTSEKVQKWLLGKEPKKVIYVKGKLISVVV